MRPPRPLRTPRTVLALICALGLAASSVLTAPGGSAASAPAPETVTLPASGSITVHWRGNGHGHGMSQYGARGAAIKGLSASRIVHFYYPGTKLVRIAPERIRVHISGAAANTTVFAGTRGLTLSGYGELPATGYKYFRLAPSGDGLRLQGKQDGKWRTLKRGLPARADFSASTHWVQVLMGDGSSTRYRGKIGALRDGSGEATINRLGMDSYVEGSVPREVPSSWEPSAVQAQAIAARSYAEASRTSARASHSPWDICDNTMCQMYGGMAHYDRAGNLLYTDDPAALTGNANEVLRYDGAPVVAQYSASNGGATVDGGEPYLVSKNDPYDSTRSGDPYLNQSRQVSVKSLANYFGLKKVTSIKITKRDGYGPWGGRIDSAVVVGKRADGSAGRISATGFDLGAATGTWTDYLRFSA